MPSPLDLLSSRPSRVHRSRVHHTRPDTSPGGADKSTTGPRVATDGFDRSSRTTISSRPRQLATTTKASERGSLGALIGGKKLNDASAAQRYAALKWDAKASDVQGPRTMPSKKAFVAAVHAYEKAKHKGLVRKQKLTLIDYTKSSGKPRLWVIDMKRNTIKAQTLVTHGVASGKGAMARNFSNESGSNMTSLGTYIVGKSYKGKFGKATFVRGLERGINDHANARTIRIHQYDNVDPRYAVATTEGCFGISNGKVLFTTGEKKVGIDYASSVIDMVKNGSVLVAYHPSILGRSSFLK